MNKFAILLLNLILISTVFAGQITQQDIPTFTDEDIEKYKKGYETDLSPQHIDHDENEAIEKNTSEETSAQGGDYGNAAQETPAFYSPKGTLPNVSPEKMKNIWKSPENALILDGGYCEKYIKQICEMFGISFSRLGHRIKLSNGMEFIFAVRSVENGEAMDCFIREK